MKSKKKLKAVYDRAKGDDSYYSFEDFVNDAKFYLKLIKAGEFVTSMVVSRSGMTRHFNTLHHNMFLNICHNGKYSWKPVRVGGCGMDMHWHLLFRACQDVATVGEMDKYRLNGKCSGQPML